MCSRVGSPRTRKKRAAADRSVGAASPEYISGKQDIMCHRKQLPPVHVPRRKQCLPERQGQDGSRFSTSTDARIGSWPIGGLPTCSRVSIETSSPSNTN